MATFRRRGTKWQVQVRRRGHAPLSRTFTLKSDAEGWARQIEASIERGDISPSRTALEPVTLLQLLERYEAVVTPLKQGAASEKYRLRVLRNQPIARLSLDRLTSSVSAYRDDRLKLVSLPSVRRELVVIQHCLEVAKSEWGEALQQNPVAKIKKPAHGKARERRVTPEELEHLRAALANRRNGIPSNIVEFAIHTGMRRGEILSVRWRDIDFDTRTVHLADTKLDFAHF